MVTKKENNRKEETRSRRPPGLAPDCSEVSHTDGAAHACVQIPADLKVGMVRAGPANTQLQPFTWTGRRRSNTGGGEVDEYLQRSSSEMEKANSSSPMFMITVLVSGHTCYRSSKH